MAKCLRFFFTSSSKVLRCHNSIPTLRNCLPEISHITPVKRQISGSVLSLHFARVYPLLTTVRPHVVCKPRRLLQTEADKELSKFLEKEIGYEESAAGKKNVKGIEGFQVTIDDADVTLTRRTGNETIVVKFSINASVDAEDPLQASEQAHAADMVSRPPFTVELCKGDGHILSMHCLFVSPEEIEQQEGPQDAEAIVDSFEIQEVAIHKGEWKDTVYSVSADIMDGNLYDLFMDMLDERGINEEFANQLVDFSTSYEHSRYLDFLKSLKSFVEK